ncbi:aldo/keto reductase [Microtetraspora sp. NBRC 13810]|uniref:aldo/keto reductase n=1 Tax=Microtetraspora sp. NBRC 13810 TaxID=3030990 RepID=UPI0025572001|nr:aldo/keto reductase [Microtetraspora sp. NBRC 13810]
MDLADMRMSGGVGLGTWAMGGSGWRFSWGPADDTDSIATVYRAVERGIDWIDTAAIYGFGHAEEILGKALAALPAADRPHVFTKTGMMWEEGDRGGGPYRIMTPVGVRRAVEDSLRRLRTERIDLYGVHWPPLGDAVGLAGVSGDPTPLEEYWQVMADLRRAGKVGAIGLSNHDIVQLDAAERVAHVDAVSFPLSLINRSATAELAWARENGSAAIAFSPMHSGLLSGTFSRRRAIGLPRDDWRRHEPAFTTRLAANLAVTGTLTALAEQRGVSTAAMAVAWTLAWPGVSGAVVGARTPEHVDGWAGADALRLTPAELTEIASALADTGAGQGPIKP